MNSNGPLFYLHSVKIDKCSGSWNDINNPYAKLCVPDAIKNINIKAFNLITRTNKTGYIEWQKTWNWSVDLMQVFVTINKDVIMINADMNAKNWLTNRYVIKDLFEIQVTVNVNVINVGENFRLEKL